MTRKCAFSNNNNKQCNSKVTHISPNSEHKYCKFHFNKHVNNNTHKIKCLKDLFKKHKSVFNFNSYIIQLNIYENTTFKNHFEMFDSFRHILNVLKLDIIYTSENTFTISLKRDFINSGPHNKFKYYKLIKDFCLFIKKFEDKSKIPMHKEMPKSGSF